MCVGKLLPGIGKLLFILGYLLPALFYLLACCFKLCACGGYLCQRTCGRLSHLLIHCLNGRPGSRLFRRGFFRVGDYVHRHKIVYLGVDIVSVIGGLYLLENIQQLLRQHLHVDAAVIGKELVHPAAGLGKVGHVQLLLVQVCHGALIFLLGLLKVRLVLIKGELCLVHLFYAVFILLTGVGKLFFAVGKIFPCVGKLLVRLFTQGVSPDRKPFG